MIFPSPFGCRPFGGKTSSAYVPPVPPEPPEPPTPAAGRWDPTTPLTGTLSAANLEEDFLELWKEYLGGYFDGREHDLNDEAVQFPRVDEFVFQQFPLPSQPLNGSSLIIAWTVSNRGRAYRTSGNEKFFQLPFTLNIYARASGSNSGTGGPAKIIKGLASLIYSLLANRYHTYYLAQKGIHRIRPQSPALVTAFPEPMRSVTVQGEIYYTCAIDRPDTDTLMAASTADTFAFSTGEEWKVSK